MYCEGVMRIIRGIILQMLQKIAGDRVIILNFTVSFHGMYTKFIKKNLNIENLNDPVFIYCLK